MSTYEIIGVAASAAGVLAVVITILAGMFRIMYLAGIHKNKVDQNTTNIEKLESSIETRFIRIEGKIDTLDSKFNTLENKFNTLENKFNTIETVVKSILSFIQGDKSPNLISQNSPLTLTEEGIKAKNLMQIDAIIDRLFGTLESEVMDSQPDNAYDVQSRSLQTTKDIANRLTKEELTRLKDYAYKAGIPIEGLTDLFGLVLRDKILRQHKIPLPQNTQQPRTSDTDTTTSAPTHTT